MPAGSSSDQVLYLTTLGRKTGREREIEIWFVERVGRLYVLAEHGYEAHWVRNVLANPAVTIRRGARRWRATGRIVDPAEAAPLYDEVRRLARAKYGWGDGLPVEFRLGPEIE